jgi:hypothetical protein
MTCADGWFRFRETLLLPSQCAQCATNETVCAGTVVEVDECEFNTCALGPAPVDLGTAGNFAVLSKSGIDTVRKAAWLLVSLLFELLFRVPDFSQLKSWVDGFLSRLFSGIMLL